MATVPCGAIPFVSKKSINNFTNPAVAHHKALRYSFNVIRPVDVFLEFLTAEQARGVSHVHLDDDARSGLRRLFSIAKNGINSQISTQQTEPTPTTKPTVVAANLTITGDSAIEQLESLRRQTSNWPASYALESLRETMVFGSGNPQARILLVGEAPGHHEEREAKPFSGESGQKLDDILKAMGLSREEVYISYIVKFRPAAPRQSTNNRKSSSQEMAAFLPILHKEIEIVKPECIIILGETTAEGLLEVSGSVPSLRGQWFTCIGTPTIVTYHPSTLLQTNTTHSTKRDLWEDMLRVMEKIGMPISTKQREFFLPKS